jgi:hypothetical protein
MSTRFAGRRSAASPGGAWFFASSASSRICIASSIAIRPTMVKSNAIDSSRDGESEDVDVCSSGDRIFGSRHSRQMRRRRMRGNIANTNTRRSKRKVSDERIEMRYNAKDKDGMDLHVPRTFSRIHKFGIYQRKTTRFTFIANSHLYLGTSCLQI